jgi:hypothetical protein
MILYKRDPGRLRRNIKRERVGGGGRGRGREGERERERSLRERGSFIGTFHNGGSRASPAHGLRNTILTVLLG